MFLWHYLSVSLFYLFKFIIAAQLRETCQIKTSIKTDKTQNHAGSLDQNNLKTYILAVYLIQYELESLGIWFRQYWSW